MIERIDEETGEVTTLNPVTKMLRADIAVAAATMSRGQARFLVDTYYTAQADRIRDNNQSRSLHEGGEPTAVIDWFGEQSGMMEKQMQSILGAYAKTKIVGRWSLAQKGIGPIIAAGLIAHIDVALSPTVGHIWAFAGYDPTKKWLGREKAAAIVREVRGSAKGEAADEELTAIAQASGVDAARIRRLLGKTEQKATTPNLVAVLAKRPWNADLKTLCWKIGESFVKVSGKDDAYYGLIYRDRKEYETAKNEAGDYADQAAAAIEEKNYGKETDAFKHYTAGHLPPARIHARAKRYAVKQFLADWHGIAFKEETGRDAPMPYPIAHQGHAHLRIPPVWEDE